MRKYTEEILNLSSVYDSKPLLYWNSLLKYYKSNKKELNETDLELLVNKIEKCRQYYNKDNRDTISQSDMNTDIHSYLETIKHNK